MESTSIVKRSSTSGIRQQNPSTQSIRRQSKRQPAVPNASASLYVTEAQPRKIRSKRSRTTRSEPSLTQDDLLARALSTEQGNVEQHQDFLKIESEKRKEAAKLSRPIATGPVLRFYSKTEHHQRPDPRSSVTSFGTTSTSKVASNFVVHEISQDATRVPTWESTMKALFGNHVNWNLVKVLSEDNRPTSRPVPTCPITGKPARYLDPRTKIPYADAEAYHTITDLLAHRYCWSGRGKRYTAYRDSEVPQKPSPPGVSIPSGSVGLP